MQIIQRERAHRNRWSTLSFLVCIRRRESIKRNALVLHDPVEVLLTISRENETARVQFHKIKGSWANSSKFEQLYEEIIEYAYIGQCHPPSSRYWFSLEAVINFVVKEYTLKHALHLPSRSSRLKIRCWCQIIFNFFLRRLNLLVYVCLNSRFARLHSRQPCRNQKN